MDVVESVDGELFSVDKARKISQRVFYAGFACLPLLWAVNVWLFWYDFLGKNDPIIKKYTRYSAVGFVAWFVMFIPWMLLYIIDGKRLLDPETYSNLDATRLNLANYGIGSNYN